MQTMLNLGIENCKFSSCSLLSLIIKKVSSQKVGGAKAPLAPTTLTYICNAVRDLVPFAQSKNHEKHPWRSSNFNKVTCFSKFQTPPWWVFHVFLNWTNGTKWRKASHFYYVYCSEIRYFCKHREGNYSPRSFQVFDRSQCKKNRHI